MTLLHYEVCRLWHLSPYEVCWYMMFVSLWRLSLMTFVVLCVCRQICRLSLVGFVAVSKNANYKQHYYAYQDYLVHPDIGAASESLEISVQTHFVCQQQKIIWIITLKLFMTNKKKMLHIVLIINIYKEVKEKMSFDYFFPIKIIFAWFWWQVSHSLFNAGQVRGGHGHLVKHLNIL